jgi:uncharacterized membrane protein
MAIESWRSWFGGAPHGDDGEEIAGEQSSTAGHHHHHGGGDGSPPSPHPMAGRLLWTASAVCAAITIVAVIALWPGDSDGFEDPLLLSGDPVSAQVLSVEETGCVYDPAVTCKLISFEVEDGAYAGQIGTIEHGESSSIARGDTIKVDGFETESGDVQFSFYDYERTDPMLVLLALFVGAVLLLGRWRGLGALAGLAFSLLVIVQFTLPAILDGRDAVIVALTSASLIAFAALFLAHGFELSTTVALLSTFASLVLTALLAAIFVGATHLTGLTDDSSFLLGGLAEGIDPKGILLAGIVIGALGVLDDVTVTQVSTVWELKRLQPELTTRDLVRPSLRIGRDHISSTVNTLFLAYAGATLPLLLLFTQAQQGFGDIATREVVATEVVRAVVGSIGLIASVPIATWLAAAVVSRPDPISLRARRRQATRHAAAAERSTDPLDPGLHPHH